MIEHNRHLQVKYSTLNSAIYALLELRLAADLLSGLADGDRAAGQQGEEAGWEPIAVRIQQALWDADAPTVQQLLPTLLRRTARCPLTYVPVELGGDPMKAIQARSLLFVFQLLARSLPRLGLIDETIQLLHAAHRIQLSNSTSRDEVSEFDELFREGMRAVVEAIVHAANETKPRPRDEEVLRCVRRFAERFFRLWKRHCQRLRISPVEGVDDSEWSELQSFIRRYGADLLTPMFLTPANLYALLEQGPDRWLDALVQEADPLKPNRLADELDTGIGRDDAAANLELLAEILLEHHDIFVDYKHTTIHSDYGERLHMLIEFIRLLVRYKRIDWHLLPARISHSVLVRAGRLRAAKLWEQAVERRTRKLADELLRQLDRLERKHGFRLQSIRLEFNQRFVHNMAVERAAALIEPIMRRTGRNAQRALEQLKKHIEQFAQQQPGAGLEPPEWIRRLEDEANRVRPQEDVAAELLKQQFQVPRITIDWHHLAGQAQETELNLDDLADL
ncbi:MAG TPA: hypothetical protein EYP14_04060 [Planctomycetaceae bacterium]|nr:hypothetical protein [Planctomycetaceae bacterium]